MSRIAKRPIAVTARLQQNLAFFEYGVMAFLSQTGAKKDKNIPLTADFQPFIE
jgi:hypothetical protein